MKKIVFILFAVQLIAVSCVSVQTKHDTRMRKINIGMQKNEVIAIMGNNYEIIGNDGASITLGYKTFYDDGIYRLVFKNDTLKEWNKEWRDYYYQNQKSENKNRQTNKSK